MLSGLALLAGSAPTRFGVFHVGFESTKDPKYVVRSQRERLCRAGSGQAASGRAVGDSEET